MNITKLFDYSQPLVAAFTILIIGMAAIAWYGIEAVYDIRLQNDTIEVTGSAKEAVVADQGRLTISLEARSGLNDQEAAAERLERGIAGITTYLTNEGLTDFETPAGSVMPSYVYPQNAEPYQTGYQLNRSVIVRSSDVAKLGALANNTTPFSGQGYTVSVYGLELTYSKLDEMRVKLLTDAIKDANDRATAIASQSSRTVGQLRNAVGGVVQVLPQGGIEISDYGSYDTQSLINEVMVTVRATFRLE
jgi:hypothetical protein